MVEAGFDLRGWEYKGDGLPNSRAAVLGLTWDKEGDFLTLNLSALDQSCDEKITKRKILSMAHRIFDPLGMVCPIMLCPRILLQETWAQNLSWDDTVDDQVKNRFLKWVSELKDLNRVALPRCILGKVNSDHDITIHTFCDASKIAYAAVVYIRIENDSGVKVNFVQAKSRVTPIKKNNSDSHPSIPRLELLAATIGIRYTESIKSSLDSLDLSKVKIYYWSDSSTVIAWIRRDCNWGTSVINRVREIREYSNPDQWNHVPGNLNPADLPSRGSSVSQLLSSGWWEGPKWLYAKYENWPNNEINYDEPEINKELCKSKTKIKEKSAILMSLVVDRKNSEGLELDEKCSNYWKLKCLVGWIFRFVNNSKIDKESRKIGYLKFEEIQQAENSILKLIQNESLTDVSDKRVSTLLPFTDEQGLIRLKTKITLRDDLYNFRCPVILPGNHEITKLIIKGIHEDLNHAGTEISLHALREKFWILGGRKNIRKVIRQCIKCQRHDMKPLESNPTPLPLNRVREAAIFEIVGVDLTGPIFLKGGQKAWVSIFTCAVFRAVHLELVTSLSTASFLLALRRHIARRGRPSVIYSDNGTNFGGLNNLFNRIDFEKLVQTRAIQQIEWIFNPPAAAWWGGFWERLNGILKRLLRRTLAKSSLDYEEMLTVLLDCEAVINSRPITFLSETEHEIVPLSPSLFLQEIKEIGVIDLDYIEKCQLDKRYSYRQKVKEDLRKRFRSEYLGTLVLRNSKCKNIRSISVGDVVLIEMPNKKRVEWPLARIKSVIHGNDGEIRVVKLDTNNGELTRPIQKIYPLELKYDNVTKCYDDVVVDKFKGTLKTNKINKTAALEKVVHSECPLPDVTTKSGRIVKKPARLFYT